MEHSAQEKYEMHALIRGQVQGVGFRASTRHHALTLGLKGTVKNLPDGSVEIYAQGGKNHLEELMKRLKDEIGSSQIEEFSIEYFPIQAPHQDFSIIY